MYLVMAHGGSRENEDWWSKPVALFLRQENAEAFIEEKETQAKAYNEMCEAVFEFQSACVTTTNPTTCQRLLSFY